MVRSPRKRAQTRAPQDEVQIVAGHQQAEDKALRETHQRRLQHDGYRFAPPILQAVVVIALAMTGTTG